MRRLLAVGLVVLALGAGAVAAFPRVADELPPPLGPVARFSERMLTQFFPPRVDRKSRLADLTAPERDAVETLAGRLDGLVVWSSNRSGNHELYLLDVGARSVRRLTSHPNVDFFSRFSPDGRQIVFLRSQREWVSARDPTAWDVYLIGADGTGERLVARGGYYPTWAPDGQAVVFLRGTQVVRHDLGTGRAQVLLDGATTEGIRGGLETPVLSPDGARLAVTVRSPLYDGVGVVDLASKALLRLSPGQACQLSWTPASGMVWVEPGGRGGTQIMETRPDGARAVLIDLPLAHSHEYFPKVGNDGRWLVWAAAAQGHEHDRADYELFVWPLGAPASEAVRLTHHTGNDQWPDLHVRR